MVDTIAAIATPHGTGALGIIRISGPQAGDILKKIMNPKKVLLTPNKMMFGKIYDPFTTELVDEVMFCFFKAPATATGEDTAEIYAHGGIQVLNDLLKLVFLSGARPANPGEFTSVAFKNNKMDLTQAEAIMDLINAKSKIAARVAVNQLSGSIGKALEDEYFELIKIGAHVESALDFPDDELEFKAATSYGARIRLICDKLKKLSTAQKISSFLRDGARIAIAGSPNAGKSSLLNKIIDEDKALVDEDPGTTRDWVEAGIEIDGIRVTFVDTAGLRKEGSKVEQWGMQKSRQAAQAADLLLLVISGEPEASRQKEIIELGILHAEKSILVWNKADLENFVTYSINQFTPRETIRVSALTGHNIDLLLSTISKCLKGEAVDLGEPVLATARQYTLITNTIKHCEQGAFLLENEMDLELAAAEIRWAREELAMLFGKHAPTDIINEIFTSFCLGK
jgi:tRNA modification GTPase